MLRRLTGAVAIRAFSTSTPRASNGLRIGYVPEHFSTPIYFAQKYYDLNAELVAFPSGTGHMIQSLKGDEIDVGIGLTEGWVAGLGKAMAEKQKRLPYQIIGTYVESPLRWAISCGARRGPTSMDGLQGKKIGVSRIGSGSYIMGYVMADGHGWITETEKGFEPIVLNTFAKLREAVNTGEADFFMWEYFTSKKYYDSGEIRHVGDIYTPWSSWKLVAQNPADQRLQPMFDALNKGIQHLNEQQNETVEYISTELDYSEEDAQAWLPTVRFPGDVKGVRPAVIKQTVKYLQKAGVIENAVKGDDMIAFQC